MEIQTQEDRTLSYDNVPLTTQRKIGGYTPVFFFYTVPGQVRYKNSRKLIFDDVNGIVSAADSQKEMREKDIWMLAELNETLKELSVLNKVTLEDIALVLQFNKRYLPDAINADAMLLDLVKAEEPIFEASVINGEGVMETMQTIVQMAIENYYTSK